MAGVVGVQGTQITMIVQGEDNATNTDQDYNTMYWTWVLYSPNMFPAEERFPRYLNIDSSIIFKELKLETNAEDFFVHVEYSLSKVK